MQIMTCFQRGCVSMSVGNEIGIVFYLRQTSAINQYHSAVESDLIGQKVRNYTGMTVVLTVILITG